MRPFFSSKTAQEAASLNRTAQAATQHDVLQFAPYEDLARSRGQIDWFLKLIGLVFLFNAFFSELRRLQFQITCVT